MKVKYFKAKKRTHRFRENQKVWIGYEFANHLEIYHRWRGNGRYVHGTIDKFAPSVGEIKEIEVSDFFGIRVSNLKYSAQ